MMRQGGATAQWGRVTTSHRPLKRVPLSQGARGATLTHTLKRVTLSQGARGATLTHTLKRVTLSQGARGIWGGPVPYPLPRGEGAAQRRVRGRGDR